MCEDPLGPVATTPATLAVGDIDGDIDTDVAAGASGGVIITLRAQ